MKMKMPSMKKRLSVLLFVTSVSFATIGNTSVEPWSKSALCHPVGELSYFVFANAKYGEGYLRSEVSKLIDIYQRQNSRYIYIEPFIRQLRDRMEIVITEHELYLINNIDRVRLMGMRYESMKEIIYNSCISE